MVGCSHACSLTYTDRMNLLALDTSTDRLCVALCVDGQVFTHEEPGGPQASQRLLPAAQALLEQQGLQWRDLHGLGFGQGPGAFTGLRGACAAVQGLALGLGLSAVAVPSLRIVAEDARCAALRSNVLTEHQACTVRVAVDARMGQVYDDEAHWDGRQWHTVRAPAVRSPAEVAAVWRTELRADGMGDQSRLQAGPHGGTRAAMVYAGSGLTLMPADAAAQFQEQSAMWMPAEWDRSAALARCMWAAWSLGPHLDAAQVMPMYVRDRVALTTAEREQQRLGAERMLLTPPPAQGAVPC